MGGPSEAAGGIEKVSPTQWQVALGPAGWVVWPEEFSVGWLLAGPGAGRSGGTPNGRRDGGIAGPDGSGGNHHGPWRFLRPAILVCLLALAVLVVGAVVEHRNELLGRSWRKRPATAAGGAVSLRAIVVPPAYSQRP